MSVTIVTNNTDNKVNVILCDTYDCNTFLERPVYKSCDRCNKNQCLYCCRQGIECINCNLYCCKYCLSNKEWPYCKECKK